MTRLKRLADIRGGVTSQPQQLESFPTLPKKRRTRSRIPTRKLQIHDTTHSASAEEHRSPSSAQFHSSEAFHQHVTGDSPIEEPPLSPSPLAEMTNGEHTSDHD